MVLKRTPSAASEIHAIATAEHDRRHRAPGEGAFLEATENRVRLAGLGIAARIRALRIRAGKSQAETAQRLGWNGAWYADPETRDGEWAETVTVFKAMELASLFGITLYELPGDPAVANERIALMELPDRILSHARSTGISIEQLQDRSGCEVHEFLRSPVQSAAELPIRFFRVLAVTLGINWLAPVPDET